MDTEQYKHALRRAVESIGMQILALENERTGLRRALDLCEELEKVARKNAPRVEQ